MDRACWPDFFSEFFFSFKIVEALKNQSNHNHERPAEAYAPICQNSNKLNISAKKEDIFGFIYV